MTRHLRVKESHYREAIFLSALAGASALGGVFYALLLSPDLDGKAYWEAVFWGGGHTLQFQHTLLMVVAWFWLASELLDPLLTFNLQTLFEFYIHTIEQCCHSSERNGMQIRFYIDIF